MSDFSGEQLQLTKEQQDRIMTCDACGNVYGELLFWVIDEDSELWLCRHCYDAKVAVVDR